MLRALGLQLAHRWRRVVALALGIVVAATGFAILTSAVSTSQLRVVGAVTRNFADVPYHILVRPNGSQLVTSEGPDLVPVDYGTGLYGGISFAQYHEIERLPGVSLAAPVATLGYVLIDMPVTVSLDRELSAAPVQLFRIQQTATAQGGLSMYPEPPTYVYFTRRDGFTTKNPNSAGATLIEHTVHGDAAVCQGYRDKLGRLDNGPFSAGHRGDMLCYSAKTPKVNSSGSQHVNVAMNIAFPVLLAAIDPAKEAKLVGLDKAMVAGRYLRDDEPWHKQHHAQGVNFRVMPMVAADTTFNRTRDTITIQSLRIPPGSDVPTTLASRRAYKFLNGLQGVRAGGRVVTEQHAYRRILAEKSKPPSGFDNSIIDYWRSGQAKYQTHGSRRVSVATNKVPKSVWHFSFSPDGWGTPPMANADTTFRPVTGVHGTNVEVHGYFPGAMMRVVGRFDPNKLRQFSRLTRLPLTTYFPPAATGADARSKRLLGGKPLRPDSNIAGYLAQPPLFLTSLQAAKPLLNHLLYDDPLTKKPISYIRVKIAGVTGPDQASLARIKAAAQSIHARTHLAVDIVIGSSPTPVTVGLPKGKFGRPALSLSEGWSQKGVSTVFVNAINKKSLVLFVLVLVVCLLFMLNAATSSVRTRLGELGTLAGVGWSRRALFVWLEAELLVIGAAAGVVGAAIAYAIGAGLRLDLPWWHDVLVIPLAAVLAGIAGLPAAWRAGRVAPLQMVRPTRVAVHRGVRPHTVAGLALANLTRRPGQRLLSAIGLVIGVGALTLVAALNVAFHGLLVGTLLGNAIYGHVRSVDLAATVLILVLGAVSVADVTYLSINERTDEIAALRATGWSERNLTTLLGTEALATAVAGSLAGGVIGVLVGIFVLDLTLVPTVVIAVIASAIGTAATALASLVPLVRLSAMTPLASAEQE